MNPKKFFFIDNSTSKGLFYPKPMSAPSMINIFILSFTVHIPGDRVLFNFLVFKFRKLKMLDFRQFPELCSLRGY